MRIPKQLSVPEARELLAKLAQEHDLPELDRIANALVRKSTGRPKASAKSQPMRASLARAIRAYAKAHADVPQSHIAHVFQVNPGRVNEALMGSRQYAH